MESILWLEPHADLSSAISEAKTETDPLLRLASVVRLSAHRRDFTQTGRLDRLAGEGFPQAGSNGFTPLRIALLASHSVEHLLPSIRVAGLHRRLALSLHVAPYGLYRQALLGDDQALEAFAPQLILLALDAHDTPLQLTLDAGEDEVSAAVDARVSELRLLWRKARERYRAQVIQQTLVATEPALFGSYEALVPAAPYSVIERLNNAIRRAAQEEGVLLLDIAWHAARGAYGAALGDPVRWHQAKQLVSPALAPLFGDQLARIAAASVGLSRKCLVLDLDNTLWGGVIGDDGVDGISLGQGSATGEAYLAFQRYIKGLASRGVILAVCSKNDIAVAEAAFEHPQMHLKRADIAAFVANWEDKASNLRTIARLLNIGLDSLVFVDDNPAERDIVRRELPEVAVPELPDDIAGYPARLAAAGYFEAVSFTADDQARGRSYAANAERNAELGQSSDMEGYLRGLKMQLGVSYIGASDLPRVTQLINKTNQFNLCTRRYTEAEVEQRLGDPQGVALAVRLTDKFGDNGLISVVMAHPCTSLGTGELLIDTWLMSCRVLGRQVEHAVLEILADVAHAQGACVLVGEYRPTPRNSMVAGHYVKLGFTPREAPEGADAESLFWYYELPRAHSTDHFIEVVSA